MCWSLGPFSRNCTRSTLFFWIPQRILVLFPTSSWNNVLLTRGLVTSGSVHWVWWISYSFVERKRKYNNIFNWSESESCSVVSDSLWPLYRSWNSLSQNMGAGSLSLLQGIFPTQGSNPGLLHYRWILCQLSYQGKNFVEVVHKWMHAQYNNMNSYTLYWGNKK